MTTTETAPVTLQDLHTLTEVIDCLGRVWLAAQPGTLTVSRYWHRYGTGPGLFGAELHSHLGPLTRVPPKPVPVWRVKGSDYPVRLIDGKVQLNAGGEWTDFDESPLAWNRVIAALAEGRDPDPALAERVEAA